MTCIGEIAESKKVNYLPPSQIILLWKRLSIKKLLYQTRVSYMDLCVMCS